MLANAAAPTSARVLEALADRLRSAHGVTVEVHSPEGDAARETLRLAEDVGAGLVAAGSHGTGFVGRLLTGSVSTRIVRSATCMVLIAPPRTVPAELARHRRDADQREPGPALR